MDKRRAKRILEELRKRNNHPEWLDPRFSAQNAFINSKATLKAVQCTRRAGKSYGCGLYAFREAYSTPNCSVVILGLTRDSVKRIFYKDILKEINSKHKIGCNFNGSDLTTTLPNGSVIYLLGVDANPDDMDKLLGQKNKLVIVDEAAFFRQDLRKLVYEVLRPSVVDYGGTIALVSTTSSLTGSLYYDIVTGKQSGWQLFKWTAFDNPFMAEKWGEEIDFLKESTPGIEDTPMFKRMYLNEWYVDADNLVYKYDPDKNNISELPESYTPYRYVLGIDLGYNDATAFVVTAYSEHDSCLYVVHAEKHQKMIVSDVAEKTKELNEKYRFETMVIDNASKQVVEELKKRYYLPLVGSEKQDKRGHIELLNSDLVTGHIKLLGAAADLATEYKELIVDERALAKGKWKEHPGLDNHLADAMLYNWRWCFNYSAKPKLVIPDRGSEAEINQWWEYEADRIVVHEEEYQTDETF